MGLHFAQIKIDDDYYNGPVYLHDDFDRSLLGMPLIENCMFKLDGPHRNCSLRWTLYSRASSGTTYDTFL